MHDLDELEVIGYDINENTHVLKRYERLCMFLNHSVICAKIPSRVLFTEVLEIIQAILDIFVCVSHGLMVS